jgi:hypothetical protein
MVHKNGEDPPVATSKGIGNLARKPSDLTRGGMAKMSFKPTLPPRKRKAEYVPNNAIQALSS